MPHCRAMPGALHLTHCFSSHGIMQAIATCSKKILFELKTKNHQNWLKLFDCIVLGDDPAVEKGKPAPDIFLIAAYRMGAEPEYYLVFEVSPSGIQAALAAGMKVVAVPPQRMDRKNFEGADQIISSLSGFEPDQWRLPACDN